MCRVPCEYKHRNLSVRVEDKSRAPGDLAIRFLYQGGQTDIVAVDVAQVRLAFFLSSGLIRNVFGKEIRVSMNWFEIKEPFEKKKKTLDVQVGSSNWKFMTRDNGPAWSTSQAPPGPLQLRVVVTGGYDGKWVWADREVLPRRWRAGEVYDTGVQITDIAQEGCFPCDTHEWGVNGRSQKLKLKLERNWASGWP